MGSSHRPVEYGARHTALLFVNRHHDVTLARETMAGVPTEAMHAAHEIHGPTYAHAIVATAELVEMLGRPTNDAAVRKENSQ